MNIFKLTFSRSNFYLCHVNVKYEPDWNMVENRTWQQHRQVINLLHDSSVFLSLSCLEIVLLRSLENINTYTLLGLTDMSYQAFCYITEVWCFFISVNEINTPIDINKKIFVNMASDGRLCMNRRLSSVMLVLIPFYSFYFLEQR